VLYLVITFYKACVFYILPFYINYIYILRRILVILYIGSSIFFIVFLILLLVSCVPIRVVHGIF
jgi:hypothetical protein